MQAGEIHATDDLNTKLSTVAGGKIKKKKEAFKMINAEPSTYLPAIKEYIQIRTPSDLQMEGGEKGTKDGG